MSGLVNCCVASPCPSAPWQLAQLRRIIPPPITPPPIIPPPLLWLWLSVRGIGTPFGPSPDWKTASPSATDDVPVAEVDASRWATITSTATAARAATPNATRAMTSVLRRERVMRLEIAELLQVLLALDLTAGVAALEDVLGRFRRGSDCRSRLGCLRRGHLHLRRLRLREVTHQEHD